MYDTECDFFYRRLKKVKEKEEDNAKDKVKEKLVNVTPQREKKVNFVSYVGL